MLLLLCSQARAYDTSAVLGFSLITKNVNKFIGYLSLCESFPLNFEYIN